MERLYIKNKESDIINLKLMMKEQHYIEVEVQNDKIRKFKHDIHNQLVVINNYIQNEFYNDAQDILNTLIKDVDIATCYNFSQNRVINTLINVKYNLMKKEFIIFEYNIKVPSKISILDKDLIAIISNILDNAIEATVKCPLSNRKISMNILYYNGALVINSKNSIQKMVVDLETHKRNILEHGLGLKSLFGCVNQYNGVYNWQSNNSEFEINIIMCDQKR
ncbi:sensor histidine kinase [Vallitalea maricola]|uniref:ATP-binding protein n=1 Tax=Vallitalea maricola TaxID=3074433 RepID=A0ACB5UN47_9FIRM|nr:ATP-binding protein [Vallitalea sp. AN17-2]